MDVVSRKGSRRWPLCCIISSIADVLKHCSVPGCICVIVLSTNRERIKRTATTMSSMAWIKTLILEPASLDPGEHRIRKKHYGHKPSCHPVFLRNWYATVTMTEIQCIQALGAKVSTPCFDRTLSSVTFACSWMLMSPRNKVCSSTLNWSQASSRPGQPFVPLLNATK